MGKKGRVDLSGQRFDKLLVLREIKCEDGRYRFVCKCDCGNEVLRLCGNLRSKTPNKSCGCYLIGFLKNKKTVHGYSHNAEFTKEYKTWCAAKYRCYNKYGKDYRKYGGRGITVYQRWLDSFENFLNDMGKASSNKYSLDRIDVDGNYEPSNCKWATDKEQSNNRRNNRLIKYDGVTKTAAQWADDLNIGRKTLLYRLNHNWTLENALNVPVSYANKTIYNQPTM